jgi:hypothetical protein
MSVKRLTWQREILERAMRDLIAGRLSSARTRLDLGIKMAAEMLNKAEAFKAKAIEAKKAKESK